MLVKYCRILLILKEVLQYTNCKLFFFKKDKVTANDIPLPLLLGKERSLHVTAQFLDSSTLNQTIA